MDDKKKYRYTKQLISMALRDGWTQKEIADTCRTQQSIVSSWKNGSALAKESQLQKLLELYGPKLRRRSFRIYHHLSVDDKGNHQFKMIKVEGEIILSFPYRNREFCSKCYAQIIDEQRACRCSPKFVRVIPTAKLLIHSMGKGDFCLVDLHRQLNDKSMMKFPETNLYSAEILGRYVANELLTKIDSMLDEASDIISQAEFIMLKMLARKALLEHGYPLDGVEEHLAAW